MEKEDHMDNILNSQMGFHDHVRKPLPVQLSQIKEHTNFVAVYYSMSLEIQVFAFFAFDNSNILKPGST